MEDIGILLLRVGTAFVYLFAAYMNIRNKSSREWTVSHTGLLFYKMPFIPEKKYLKIMATIGIAIMILGGLSILLGIEARLGAIVLTGFTLMGILIHRNERLVALDLQKKIGGTCKQKNDALISEITWSAFSGHYSSGLKNWGLVAVMLFFVCAGAGDYSIIDSCARFIDLE